MHNTATLVDEPEKQTTRFTLPEPWIPLLVLSLIGCGPLAKLEDTAETIAIKIEHGAAGICVETRHLSALLPPELVKLARGYQPVFGAILRPDHAILGFEERADSADVRALAERRGVMFKDGKFDRNSLGRLAQLLEREQRFPQNDSDWVACNTCWSRLVEAMATQASWEQEPALPPPPRIRQPWDDAPREDDRKFTHRDTYNPDEECEARARCMGVRVGNHPRTAFGRGRKWANKFDLYRRLGFVFGKPDDLTYRVEEYREMMNMAYNEVFTSTKEPANV